MQTIIYKKKHKNKIVGIIQEKRSVIKYGYFGLKILSSGILTGKQIETVRRVISRITKRNGKILIRVFFYHPLTKKPSLSRMGKGVGAIKIWIAYVKAGTIIIELNSLLAETAILALRASSLRLPMSSVVVSREILSLHA